MRKQIAQSLKTRSKSIQNAIASYNEAAASLSPGLVDTLTQRLQPESNAVVHCHQGWGWTETKHAAIGVPGRKMDKRRTKLE